MIIETIVFVVLMAPWTLVVLACGVVIERRRRLRVEAGQESIQEHDSNSDSDSKSTT